MKKIINGLFASSCLLLAVSCADYNETTGFSAEPDPSVVVSYNDLNPVKSYINRSQYPNMRLGAQFEVSEFNKQELSHAAAVTNFDDAAFGATLMSGKIVNAKGVMNFLDMKDLLDHVEEIGGEVFGSPIVANANQADEWLSTLTAPIEIVVDYVEGKEVNFNDMPVGKYRDTKASVVKYDNQNVLKIGQKDSIAIIDGFEVDPLAKYTVTFYAKADKDITFDINFSGTAVTGSGPNGKWVLKQGKWTKFAIEAQSAEGVTDGYLSITTARGITIYIQKVQVGYYPDNHRPQTAQELNDTINYGLNAWCDGLMKINAGRIKSFDLIDEAIDNKEIEPGIFDLKHSADKIFWQDVLGSANYAPAVSKVASAAYEKYGGDAAALKFFISESGLDVEKKFNSLNYWINVWEQNGAKIDGINAKVNLTFSEDATTRAANEAAFDKLLDNLKKTGKLIRLSNFDIKYKDAAGASVSAKDITTEQRQKLADYHATLIKKYLTVIDADKQAGICKANIVDTGDPVGLWAVDSKTKDWVRTATYKAFCDALSGK